MQYPGPQEDPSCIHESALVFMEVAATNRLEAREPRMRTPRCESLGTESLYIFHLIYLFSPTAIPCDACLVRATCLVGKGSQSGVSVSTMSHSTNISPGDAGKALSDFEAVRSRRTGSEGTDEACGWFGLYGNRGQVSACRLTTPSPTTAILLLLQGLLPSRACH